MGVLCGLVTKNIKQYEVKDRIKNAFLKQFKGAFFYEDDYVFLGILHSDVSLQSIYEKGPVIDEKNNLIIIADAEIDNRKELIQKLNISLTESEKKSDSELILNAYVKWKEQCIDYLLGEFSFVVYNILDHSVFCVRDQLGIRKFYYIKSSNFLAFSTNMTALFPSSEKKLELNDLWIANFLSLQSPVHDIISTQTIYKDIMQLEPGNYFIDDTDKFKIRKYWGVNIYNKRTCTFEEASEGMREILSTIIYDKIKTKSNVGIFLSGGLDSGSISVLASRHLKSNNKQLFGYSSIPLSKYNITNKNYSIGDETEYINSIIENDKNIVHKFITSESKNSITEIEKNLEYLEHPYKFIENFFWINSILESAKADGCKVILNGAFGNCTISFGNFQSNILTLLSERKYFEAITEIEKFSKFEHVSKKYLIRKLIKLGMPYLSSDYYKKHKMEYKDLPVNQAFAKDQNIELLHRQLKIGQFSKPNMTVYDYRKTYISSSVLSQINAIKSTTFNRYGIQIKDPTLDVRMINYCFSLPYNYYVNNGRERELIRKSMEGLLPDKIRLNYNKRGVQSADWIFRLNEHFEELKKDLSNLLNNDIIHYYIDVDKIRRIIRSCNSILDLDRKTVWMLVVSLIFCKFIKLYDET